MKWSVLRPRLLCVVRVYSAGNLLVNLREARHTPLPDAELTLPRAFSRWMCLDDQLSHLWPKRSLVVIFQRDLLELEIW